MTVTLRRFSSEDLRQYAAWREVVGAWRYMSRWFPRCCDGKTVDENPDFRWFIIVHDRKDVGTVWLEREESDGNVVRLGILIGLEDRLDKGIGREAINQAISTTQGDLNFATVRLNVRKDNTRAIACYMACGFRTTNHGVKPDGEGGNIEFFTMEKEIHQPSAAGDACQLA